MRKPHEDDEEDLRTYASVFERLTPGTPRVSPTRQQQLIEHGRKRASALGERARVGLAEVGTRLWEEGIALARRVRERIGDPAHWRSGCGAERPAVPLHREPSIFVGLLSFAFAFSVAWWTGAPTDEVRRHGEPLVAEQAVPTVAMQVPSEDTTKSAGFDAGRVLRTPGASEATQLAVVDELTRNSSDDATRALLAGIDSASVYVSMACLRALAGRPCDALAPDLARRLDDSLWQRRAWAARILGSNDCAGARRQLAQRLTVERDLRVQAQLKHAIESLKEPGA
jgi:hypothetical protein